MVSSEKAARAPGIVVGEPATRRWPRWAIMAAFAGLASLHGAVLYGSAGYDDTHITYWPAYALSALGEIVNFNGERVEQSSSLLLVVLLAIAYSLLPIAMSTLGAAVSILSGLLTLVLSCRLADRLGVAASWRVGLILAVSPQLVFWSWSGMETPLAALCVVWFLFPALDLLQKGLSPGRLFHLAVAAVSLLMVRPEACFVAIAFAGAIALCISGLARISGAPVADGRRAHAAVGAIATVLCLILVLLCGWRYLYFGSILPQPVTAKVGGDLLDRIADGGAYLLLQSRSLTLAFLFVLAVVGIVRTLLRRRDFGFTLPILALGCFIAAQLAFILFSGGDWMRGSRFMVPIIPILAIVALIGLDMLHPDSAKARNTMFCILLALAALDSVQFAFRISTGIPLAMSERASAARERYLPPEAEAPNWFEATNLIHLRDMWPAAVLQGVIDDLRAHEGRPIRILSGQMGLVAYHVARDNFGALEIIDRRGLTTRHLDDCATGLGLEPTQFGYALTYEDLFRDRPEIWKTCGLQRPDVVFDLAKRPGGPADHLPIDLLERNGYALVYRQSGWIQAGLSRALRADEAIMVRRDLIAEIDPARFVRNAW